MKIDYDKIAEGLDEVISEEDKAIITFGMIPKSLLETCTKMFKELMFERLDLEEGEEVLPGVTFKINPIQINEFEQGITVALLKRYCKF